MALLFIAVKNRYLILLVVVKFATTQNGTKTSRNEVMQPTTSNSDSRPIFPYHVHNQAGFDNPFINRRGFIYLGVEFQFLSIYKSSR